MKAFITNIKEIVVDLDNAFKIYEYSDDNMKYIVGNSIRRSFVQIREEIFLAITIIMKSSSIPINSINKNIELVYKCREERYFKNVDDTFL